MQFFNRFNLQTPESVELEFTLAGIGNRAYALLIDYTFLLVIFIIYLLLTFIFSQLLAEFINVLTSNVDNVKVWLIAVALLIGFFTDVGYFAFFETLWQGQTPGKRFVKIRVIRDEGRPVRLQQAILRSLLRPFDDILFIGAFLIAFSKREKRLGDWLAGTIVIQEEKPISSAIIFISPEARVLASQLKIEADLSRLSPEDFAVIREYLQRRDGMLTQAKHELSRKLAYQVKNIIALEDVPEGITANIFLEAVYLAYQQRFSENE